MSFFNEKEQRAILTGEYICPECGKLMEFEDDSQETLVCPHCGNDIAFERYGLTDEEYDNLYPTESEVLDKHDDHGEDDSGETYDEVYGELDRD